jgi:ubiquinone/menaquinone biosynthesis C-methylase UbiE
MKGYQSAIFDPISLEHAKDIVLTPDDNDPNRFTEATKYFVDVIKKENLINESSIVLDFGVGMGRVSKELIDDFNCKIVGTDISLNMLVYATQYVNNPKNFVTCNKVTYTKVFDVCIASFVLQHVENPIEEIENIYNSLKLNGYLVCLNNFKQRLVPGDWREDKSVIWFDDHFDIFKYLNSKFQNLVEYDYPLPNHKIVIYKKP